MSLKGLLNHLTGNSIGGGYGISMPVQDEKKDNHKTYTIQKEKFTVDHRYVPCKKLGRGAYGMVVSAKDNVNGNKVAIKKNKDIFSNITNGKRILREMRLLNHMNHPNIVKVLDIIEPESIDEFNDVYIVLEHMQSDLHKVIYSDNDLSEEHILFITYQMLCALKYMHSANIIHRDLKPGNILINADCSIKICDLGLARGVGENDQFLTEYVVTRWYRAPEVVLNAQLYDQSIDIWSVGCIMAEMYNKKPLFRGEDYADQLKTIFRILGSPAQEDIEACVTNADALRFIERFGIREGRNWEDIVPRASDEIRELMKSFLQFNPSKRMTVDDALMLPIFSRYYDEDFVNTTCIATDAFNCDYEKMSRTKSAIQSLMIDEIKKFRPEIELLNYESSDLDEPSKPSRISTMFKHRRSQTQV